MTPSLFPCLLCSKCQKQINQIDAYRHRESNVYALGSHANTYIFIYVTNTGWILLTKRYDDSDGSAGELFLMALLLPLKVTFFFFLTHKHPLIQYTELAAGRLAGRWFNAINPSLERDTACPFCVHLISHSHEILIKSNSKLFRI